MFLYSNWMNLPLSTRQLLAYKLNIPKRHPIHVDSNRIVSDGYDIKEVETALLVENMQRVLHSTEKSFDVLFNKLVAIVEGREEEVQVVTLKTPIPVEKVLDALESALEKPKAKKVTKKVKK